MTGTQWRFPQVIVLVVAAVALTVGLIVAVVDGAGARIPAGDKPRLAATDEPSRLSGRLIVNTKAAPTGVTRTSYQGSTAECGFLHAAYPAHVPAESCSNTVTLTSVDKAGKVLRKIQLCSSYSCAAWHADLTFTVSNGRTGVRPAAATCHYGGLAYRALRSWTSSTEEGIAEEGVVAADFFVLINGIPVTVEWHLRARNSADGSWHVVVYHT